MSSKWPFPLGSLTKTRTLCTYLSPRVPHFAPVTSSIWLRIAQTMKLLSMQLSPSSCYLPPHSPEHHVCFSYSEEPNLTPTQHKMQNHNSVYCNLHVSHTKREYQIFCIDWWRFLMAIYCGESTVLVKGSAIT